MTRAWPACRGWPPMWWAAYRSVMSWLTRSVVPSRSLVSCRSAPRGRELEMARLLVVADAESELLRARLARGWDPGTTAGRG